jgi:hypothetical protein
MFAQNLLIPSGIEYAYEATSFLVSLRQVGQGAVRSATRYVKAHAWVVWVWLLRRPRLHAPVCTITCIVLLRLAPWGAGIPLLCYAVQGTDDDGTPSWEEGAQVMGLDS